MKIVCEIKNEFNGKDRSAFVGDGSRKIIQLNRAFSDR